MARLIRLEWLKMYGKLRSWLGFAIVLALAALFALGFRFGGAAHGMEQAIQNSLGGEFVIAGSIINGFFLARILFGSFFFILVMFTALAVGDIVAGESQDGTLRTILCRPPSRTRVLLAKAVTAVGYVGSQSLFMMAAPLVIFLLVFGGGPMLVGNWQSPLSGIAIVAPGEALARLGLLTAYATLALSVVAMLALLLSVLVDRPLGPAVGTVVILFALLIMTTIPVPVFEHISKYSFIKHMIEPLDKIMAEPIPWHEIGVSALWLAGYAIGFALLALLIFRRRDIRT
jgi:ABC-2 type transport system permease protein